MQRAPRAVSRRRARAGRVRSSPRSSRTRMSRRTTPSAGTASRFCKAKASRGRTAAGDDPLQRRMAGDGRRGNRARAHLCGARCGFAGARLGIETRPRNQGASLTAWELGQHGVPYTAIVDNAAGHLMQRGKSIWSSSEPTAPPSGDVANKIGTYLKAVAARDYSVPFYVAAPSSSIDWSSRMARKSPSKSALQSRSHVSGRASSGRAESVQVLPSGRGRPQLRLRRHTGPAGDRTDYRAGSLPGIPSGYLQSISRASQGRSRVAFDPWKVSSSYGGRCATAHGG